MEWNLIRRWKDKRAFDRWLAEPIEEGSFSVFGSSKIGLEDDPEVNMGLRDFLVNIAELGLKDAMEIRQAKLDRERQAILEKREGMRDILARAAFGITVVGLVVVLLLR